MNATPGMLRMVRVRWHAALDPEQIFQEEVLLEEGLTDEINLPKILAQRHPDVVDSLAAVVIDAVRPADLVKALVLLVGPPGCGKTTWVQARFNKSQQVRLDDWREAITGDAGDQSGTETASAIQDLLVQARLQRGLLTVVDGTNAEPKHRHRLIRYARQAQLPIIVVYFTATVDECMDNMAGRDRKVDRAVVQRIADQIHKDDGDIVGTTDVMMIVDRHGDTTAAKGYWRSIEYFTQWRRQLEARAAEGESR